jgi:4-hydroxy-2-oxovalerate aldolase
MKRMTTNPDVDILEVTLRDGSYLIDFQFTAEDTSVIAAALQAVGFRWIELGHGVGLNGSGSATPRAAASDEEYLEAASSALDKAQWGMFFIPGVGRADDLRLAARYGMKFVRIGTNVTETEQARASIELAKELGMFVSYNAMKSYAVAPAEFGRRAAEAQRWGADVVCLVDSAGSFDGDTVASYMRATRDASDVGIGFHAHDNLSMAVANTVRAVEEGAVLVDASLQGMGRSAGNAITEIVVGILQQRGLVPHIDLKDAMDVGRSLIQPLLGQRGVDPLAVTAGLARFHSSFMPKVTTYARRHGIDVRDLIVRLTQEDQISAPDALLEELSRDLAAKKMPHVIDIAMAAPRRSAATPAEELDDLVRHLRSHAVKGGKYAALNVVRNQREAADLIASRNIESTPSHVIGVVAVASPEQLDTALRAARGVDVVLLDVDRHARFGNIDLAAAREKLGTARLLTYLDSELWVRAVEAQIVRILSEAVSDAAVSIVGRHANAAALAAGLERRGARMVRDSKDARVVVIWPAEGALEEIGEVASGTFILDAAIGGLSPAAAEAARGRGALLLRVNMWPEIAGALMAAHESARVVDEALGWGTIAGTPAVSGGALGRRGDVIVDSVRIPTRVVGVADGRGGVLFDVEGEDERRVRKVREEIIRRRLQAP